MKTLGWGGALAGAVGVASALLLFGGSAPRAESVAAFGAFTDLDDDGIPDLYELFGYSGPGGAIDFPGLGASPLRKDVFVEADVMTGVTVPAGAFEDVVTAFAEAPVVNPDGSTGISLHIDASGTVPYFDEIDFGDHGGHRKNAAIAVNASGQIAVGWADDENRNAFYEIRARRFSASVGSPSGQINVNSTSSGHQVLPDLAQSASGDTVVVWADDRDDNGYYEIKGRVFDSTGSPVTGEVSVNTVSDGQQTYPSVGMDTAGNWLVAWQDDRDGNGYWQIKARKFDRTGTALTAEISVNAESSGQQQDPDVAMASDGRAIVTWEDDRDDNGYYEIYARLITAAGAAAGSDLHINEESDGQQCNPCVGASGTATFVVAWQDDRDGNGYYQIYGRRFQADGVASGGEFVVNTTSDGQQTHPAVGMNTSGAFAVAWQDDRDGNGYYQVYARAFRSTGTARTGEIAVNTVSTDQQQLPGVGMADSGAFAVAYQDDRDSNNLWKVYVRAFQANGAASSLDVIAHLDTASFSTLKDAHFTDARLGFYHYCIVANRRVNTGSSGIANIVGDDLIVSLGLTPSRVPFGGTFMHELGHNLGLRHGGNENRNYKPNYMSVLNYRYQFFGADHDCDAASGSSDVGVLDYSGGRRFSLNESSLDESVGVCDGALDVNEVSAGQQIDVAVDVSDGGDFVVAWEDDRDGNGYYEVVARLFPSGFPGALASDEVVVNPVSTGQQRDPAVGVADADTFVVAWEDDRDGNGYNEVYARRFDGGGVSPSGEFRVHSESSGNQSNPEIAVASDGTFVVVWEDDRDDNGYYEIYARLFSASGVPLTGDVPANSTSDGQQRAPRVAIADDHRFVVAWEDDSDGNGYYEIRARRFDTFGNALGSDIRVNDQSDGQQRRPDVGVASDGRFVAVWEDDGDGNGVYQIHARRFGSSGAALASGFTVNSVGSGQQRYPRVDANDGFGFVVAWQDDQDDNGYYQIYARAYGSSGTAAIPDVRMNLVSDGQQLAPDVAIDSGGQFYAAWQDDSDGNGYYEIDGVRATTTGGRRDAAPIDWDGDGTIESDVSADINNADGSMNTLKDYNDWGHLILDF